MMMMMMMMMIKEVLALAEEHFGLQTTQTGCVGWKRGRWWELWAATEL